ncbi:MAG: hypothetical protein ACOYB0_08400 [Polynucleobacter sp.]
MIASAIQEHAARHRFKFLNEHGVAVHHHECSQGDTWRVDFAIDGAADVAFGITLDSAVDEAMRRARMPMPPLLMHSPATPHAVSNQQSATPLRKWLSV